MDAVAQADLLVACKHLAIDNLELICEDAAKYKGTHGAGLGDEMCVKPFIAVLLSCTSAPTSACTFFLPCELALTLQTRDICAWSAQWTGCSHARHAHQQCLKNDVDASSCAPRPCHTGSSRPSHTHLPDTHPNSLPLNGLTPCTRLTRLTLPQHSSAQLPAALLLA